MKAGIKLLASVLAPAVLVGAGLLALPACAAVQVYTTPLGNLDPADAGFFDAIVAKKTQPFEDIGTFDLTVSALTDVAAHIGVNGKGNYSPGALSLYEGIPGSGTLIET